MTLRSKSRRPEGFSAATRKTITARSGGICELDSCGPAEVIHHRRPRGAGGTSLDWVNGAANGLHVANTCHDWAEGRDSRWSREMSRANGWLVPMNGRLTAAEVPVLRRGRWVLLTDHGDWFDTVPPEGGAA